MKPIFSNKSSPPCRIQNSVKSRREQGRESGKIVLASATFLPILVKGEKIGEIS
jgi:hypothetical protein